jgi:hypothetical protein
MKKLLLVLAVVAMASFLFVGCLPGGTTPDPDPDPDPTPDPVQAVTSVIEDQYPADVKEFIRADLLDVTITFVIAIPTDQSVTFQAKEAWATTPKEGAEVELTPNTARTVWTYANYDFNNTGADPLGLGDLDDCDEICLYVTIADCCDPLLSEVFTEVVKLDDTAPVVDLVVTFEDCADNLCADDPGAYFTFEPDTTGDICDPEPCCEEECSGIASWSIVDTTLCDPCPTVSGTGCPEGTFDCVCLIYAGEGTETYTLEFTITDNVGNAFEDTWVIIVDTDSVVSLNDVAPDGDGVVMLYENCDPEEVVE